MEYTLFQEDTAELVAVARQRLLLLDQQGRFDAKDQLHYQEYLNFLRGHAVSLYDLPQRWEEGKNMALNDDFFAFLGDYSKLKPIVLAQGLISLSDVFEVDRMTFLSWSRCSNTKWEMWVAMRTAILEKWDDLLYFQEKSQVEKCFPIRETEENLSLSGQFDLMCEQYLAALLQYAEYYPKMKEIAERLAKLMVIGVDLDAVAQAIGVTKERIRQFKDRYLPQLCSGCLTEVPHLKLDVQLFAAIRSFEQAAPRYKSVAYVNHFMGCEDYRQTHLPLFFKMKKLFEVDNSGTYPYFDQPYFLPEEESVELIKTYVTTMIKALGASAGAEIRPVSLSSLKVLMGQLEPTFNVEEEVLLSLLHQHTWVECLPGEEEELYQLQYIHLRDYQKIARIVFEEKQVDYDRIQKLDREKSTDGQYLNHLGDNAIISKRNYNWVCASGVEGILNYEESGQPPLSLMEVIQQLVRELKIFTFSEVIAELNRRNYGAVLNENSVKIYILRDCVSCLDDAQLYCHLDYLDTFSSHRWRSRNRNIRNMWVAFTVRLLRQEETHSMPVAEINRLVLQEMEKNGEQCDIANPVAYMRERLCVRDLLGVENKTVFLMSKAEQLSEEELDQLDVNITCKPKSVASEQAEQFILSQLTAAEGKELPLKQLKECCAPFFAGKSSTYFYTFIKRPFPFRLERTERDGVPFLKLIE